MTLCNEVMFVAAAWSIQQLRLEEKRVETTMSALSILKKESGSWGLLSV